MTRPDFRSLVLSAGCEQARNASFLQTLVFAHQTNIRHFAHQILGDNGIVNFPCYRGSYPVSAQLVNNHHSLLVQAGPKLLPSDDDARFNASNYVVDLTNFIGRSTKGNDFIFQDFLNIRRRTITPLFCL
jgi:hypothetical protein